MLYLWMVYTNEKACYELLSTANSIDTLCNDELPAFFGVSNEVFLERFQIDRAASYCTFVNQ